MLKLILLTFCFLIFTYSSSFAQKPANRTLKSEIQGVIFNENNEAVRDAHISLLNPPKNDVSDHNGKFTIGPLDAGRYTIRVEHISYQTIEIENIAISQGVITVLDTIILSTGFYESESVVVTATRSHKKVEEIIPIVNMVSRQQIARRNSKTSAEALREESGVFIQKTNHGGGSAIIRGLSSNQILILVDGIRLNNSTYRLGNHQYLTTVDNNMLDRIEVVHGPLSVLHGSDALGGTINLITEIPLISSENKIDYNINSRFSSADSEKMLSTNLKYFEKNLIFQSGFSYKNYGDLIQGSTNKKDELLIGYEQNTQKPTGFTAYDFTGKIIYEPRPKQNLILAYQLSRQEDVPRFDKYAYNDFYKWLYTPQKRDLIYGVYENKNKNGFFNSFRTSLSYHRQQEGRQKQKTIVSDLIKEIDDVQTIGFTFQAQSNYKEQLLNFGLDYYSDFVNSKTTVSSTDKIDVTTRGRFPDDSRYSSFGIFLEDEYSFSTDWQANAGIRFSHFQTDFTIKDTTKLSFEKKYNALTGSFGIIYKPNQWSSLSTNISQGFRAPNLSDLAKFGESKGSIFEVPNLNVNPEKALSIDLNYKLNKRLLKFSAAIYYMQISDLLISSNDLYNGSPNIVSGEDTLSVKSKQNGGKAFITGFESSLNFALSNSLKFRSNLSFTFGENQTANEPVGGIPPLFGLVGASWQQNKSFSEFYLRFAAAQTRLSSDDFDDPRIPIGGTPEWFTLNVRTEYEFNNWIRLNLAVENILDHLYREHGSGINAPGRNFIVGIKLSR
ncbi:MAG: TonB-dependent receptor [Calditrichaeota bacterium]|nr:MAG: TonB-dependent receptor [Calditrichota bacterium]MBL1206811.1 TonB-dependent receptor [Calditrichota bacterium]NOG46639.1 TonB-dependent receptor [Calditrichota bacterium]